MRWMAVIGLAGCTAEATEAKGLSWQREVTACDSSGVATILLVGGCEGQVVTWDFLVLD